MGLFGGKGKSAWFFVDKNKTEVKKRWSGNRTCALL
jgi:hypothetical protein